MAQTSLGLVCTSGLDHAGNQSMSAARALNLPAIGLPGQASSAMVELRQRTVGSDFQPVNQRPDVRIDGCNHINH